MDNEQETINSIDTTSIVDDIVLGQVSKARDSIQDLLQTKITDEIDDYKKEFAATLFVDIDSEAIETEFDDELEVKDTTEVENEEN